MSEAGYIDASGNKIKTGDCHNLNEVSQALEQNSSKGEGGAYVELQEDAKYYSGEIINVTDGRKATVYLNGHVVDGSHSSAAAFKVLNNATLVIEGGNKNGETVSTQHVGYIDQSKGSGKLWKTGSNSSKTEASIEGGLFTGFSNNAVRVAGSGHLTCNNVTFAGNRNCVSLLIYVGHNSVDLKNSTIKWNSSIQGGGIEIGYTDDDNIIYRIAGTKTYTTNVDCTLDNSSICENIGNDGGGICVYRSGALNINLKNHSKVNDNYATQSGGGIFLSTRSTYANFLRDDSMYSDTTAVTLTGGSEICGNYACGSGGGIFGRVHYENIGGRSVRGKRTITVEDGSKVSDNTACSEGGGMYLEYDERTGFPQYPYMEVIVGHGAEVSGNKAGQGGGIFTRGTAWQQVTLNGGHIDGNEALNGNGGGVYASTRLMDISLVGGATINNNKASQSGGGIGTDEELNMSMYDGSQVNGNTAIASEGGGICAWGTATAKIAMFHGSQISGNRAQVRGGGVSFTSSGTCSIAYDETSADYEDEDFGVGVISYNAVLATDRETKGGGIYCGSPTVTLRNVDVNHNSLDSTKSSGGGIYIDHSSTFLINCSVTNNKTAGGSGGGVEVFVGGSSAFAILGGKVVVKDNANGSGDRSNVHVAEKASNKSDVENDNNQYNNRIAESSDVPLTSDSFVGLQHWTGTDAAKHAVSAKGQKIVADAACFSADDYEWSAEKIDDVVWLVKKCPSYSLTLYTEPSTDAAKVESREYNSTVTIDGHDWAVNGNAPDYWTAEGLGTTTKLTVDESGKVTFTMPHNNVTLRAHYKSYITFLNIGIEDSNSLTDADSSLPISCSGIAVEDNGGVRYVIPEDYPDIDAKGLARITRSYVTKDDYDCHVFDYTVTIDPALASKLDLVTLKGQIGSCVSTLHDSKYALSYSADSRSVEVKDDGSIALVFRYTFPEDPETASKTVTVSIEDENTKKVLLSDKQSVAGESSFTWKSSAYVSRLTGATWVLDERAVSVPDGWSLKDGVLSCGSVTSDADITLCVKPQVAKVTVEVPQLTVGEAFPDKVSSYVVLDSSDPANSRDITELVNKDVKIGFTTLDGRDAGDTVKEGACYRVTITTGKLAEDGYVYAAPATMTNTAGSSCVVLNDETAGVFFASADSGYTVTGQMRAVYSTDFDKQITYFPRTRVSHAAECLDILPSEASYQLKNKASLTSDITWDTSAVDDAMASGEFTVYGSYEDVHGTKHDVSQTFYLANLYGPTASPSNLVYEDSQEVSLSLDASFQGVTGTHIYYCVKTAGEAPADSDYRLYTGPLTVDKADGRDQVVYAYAMVGQRKTNVNSFEYIFAERHAVRVFNGVAKDGEGNVVTSALENQDVYIYANDAAEGDSFSQWVLYKGTPDIEDAASAQTSFCMGDSDVEVMAEYSAATYTVGFNTRGGSEIEAQSIYHDGVASRPATDPTREGYEFEGWYADAACTQVFDFSQAIKKDTTVYAKWAGLITVSFDAAGGEAVDSALTEKGASLGHLPTTTRTGYVFTGWYNGDTRVTASTTFNASVTLTAHWQPLFANVYFMDGYRTLGTVLVEFGRAVPKPADPGKEGYAFAGWYYDRGFTQEYDFTRPVLGSMSLFAKWDANSYTVAFSAGEGASNVPDVQTVEHGGTAAWPDADPVRAGYVFKGWYADKACTTEFDFSAEITADTTVYAKWAKQVTVSFDAAGGSSVDPVKLEQGSSLGDLPVSTKENYDFAGWALPDGTKANASTTFDADATLTAKWVKLVTVTFDAQGGSSVDPVKVEIGGSLSSLPKPARAGYVFKGWYMGDKLVDSKTVFDADVTLKASWAMESSGSVGSSSSTTSTTQTASKIPATGDAAALNAVPAAAGAALLALRRRFTR